MAAGIRAANSTRRLAARASIALRPKAPFDLPLSLAAAASFVPAVGPPPKVLRTAVQFGRTASIVEISQPSNASGLVCASSSPALAHNQLCAVAKWLIAAELDLHPFYALAATHPIMRGVTLSLSGLKPLRPHALFEMAIIAITEQQLSLAAAFRVRTRLIERFGKALEDLWVFPSPERLVAASPRSLHACGLSRRKADYVKGLARQIADGTLDFEALKRESDQQIRETLMGIHGFGEWSAQYVLSRGLARFGCLPSTDVGLRRVIGHYFANGRRLTPMELESALAPFKPFRSLAAFYLAVHWQSTGGCEPANPPPPAPSALKLLTINF